jgi:hypothetical protein
MKGVVVVVQTVLAVEVTAVIAIFEWVVVVEEAVAAVAVGEMMMLRVRLTA